ncbi:hypothetical protein FHR84_000835 [Actinopolyspora biskrensis]|uniref:Uncharacterized protein n=1 Tax=Actinopolyspora biskrensis TaxID=1470178 RepID=A0A852YS25_9ACTN|nr:hypothetical protein [Actinopolyspora biskrensis]NYH77521.1 hypothetical protein [Actinopolyspora biskrensis]
MPLPLEPASDPRAHARSSDQSGTSSSREAAKKRLTDAETRLRRFQEAIEAGVDPAALAETINEAQAERAAATAELDATPTSSALSEAEIHARIDSLGDIGPALANTSPDKLANPYTAVSPKIRHQPDDHATDVTIEPVGQVNSKDVGGDLTPDTWVASPFRGLVTMPSTVIQPRA